MTGTGPTERRSLIALLTDVPRLIIELIQAEIAALKAEIASKLKSAGIGAGLLVGAATVAFFAALTFTAAAVLGLAEVLPAWAAALIVGGILIVIAGVLVAMGIAQLKRGLPPTPTETIESINEDVRIVRGVRKG